MSKDSQREETKGYEGWSRYQMLVLQQLEDHNTVLQNLNKEVVLIKQTLAVQEAQTEMWKTQIETTIERIQEEMNDILHDEKGVTQRLNALEREFDIEEQSNTKNKATWALYGSIAMFAANIAIQLLSMYFKIKS